MHNIFKFIFNHARHVCRDMQTGGSRSSRWSQLEKEFKETNPTCAACGSSVRVQVHHKQPFHVRPELELDPNNLISLCMGPNFCHLYIGHGDFFKAWNPNVVADAADALAHPEKRQEIVERAKSSRVLAEDVDLHE